MLHPEKHFKMVCPYPTANSPFRLSKTLKKVLNPTFPIINNGILSDMLGKCFNRSDAHNFLWLQGLCRLPQELGYFTNQR